MAGGSRAQVNKSHKTRFASKASRNIHKTSVKDKSKISKPDRNAMKGARAARLQRNKMMREQKRAALVKEKRASSGTTSAPRIIVLFGLSASTSVSPVAGDLLALLSNDNNGTQFPAVASSEYRLRATVLEAPRGDLMACMEMAKIADLILFVASAKCSSEHGSSNYYIDEFGSQCLSVFRSLGFPSSAVFLRDLPSDLKKRNDMKKTCISSLASQFPEDCKVYPADTKDDLHKFMSLFKEQRITIPHWRTQRPYLMAQKVDMVADGSGKCTLLVTGYVRARNLSVNQLVHVSGAGDFQLGKIELLKDPCSLNVRKEGDLMDADEVDDSQALFMPYDHKNTTPAGLQSQKMKLMLETLNHLHCGDRCVVGSGGGSVGYLAHGTTTDYTYDVARVPMSFTFEIYGDEKASSRDCFKMFNPVDHSTFNRVLNEWSATFFSMFNMGAHQMNLQDSIPVNVDHLISIDDYLNGYLIERKNRYGEKKEFC